MPGMIRIIEGDITEMETDAIVNAANNNLTLGAGVAGAIRKKGGPSIQEECNLIGPISLGEAAITGAGNLKARYVIHAASMAPGEKTTEDNLRNSVVNSLKRADERLVASVAFPAIGTGIAGFPLEDCARVMIKEAMDHLKTDTSVREIDFVLFGNEAYRTFIETYEKMKD